MTINELLEKDAFSAIDWLVENKNDFELVPAGQLTRRQQGQIESQYSVCDYCGSEQAGVDEASFNKRAMISFSQEQNKN